MNGFPAMNGSSRSLFHRRPSRVFHPAVSRLPKDALVEIEVIASA